MSLTLYAHPFSSYCQKMLIARTLTRRLRRPLSNGEV